MKALMDQERLARWEERLCASHRRRPALNLSPEWQRDLMREIVRRAATARLAAQAHGADLARLWLRFAGATAVLALALGLYARLFAPDLATQAACLLLERPLGLQPLEMWLGS